MAVRKYADALYSFVISQGLAQVEAEDIVQECFEVLWKKKKEVRLEKSKPFLFQVAYNKSMDVYRHRKKQKLLEAEERPENTNVDIDTKKWIMKAMHNLSPTQRSAILLKDWEGYSYQEISEIMHISLAQVKVNIHRGRKNLRSQLQFLKS